MAGRSQLGSGVSLAEGSFMLCCVIPAFTEKCTKGFQLALHLMLLDPLASCFSALSHLVIQVTLENIKHVFFLWLFCYPNLPWDKLPTPSPQLKSFIWIADGDSENSPWVFRWCSSLIQQRHFAAQHPDASSSHPSHPLLSLLVHSQCNWLPGGQQTCIIGKEDWRLAHPHHVQMSGLPWIQRAEASLSPPSI